MAKKGEGQRGQGFDTTRLECWRDHYMSGNSSDHHGKQTSAGSSIGRFNLHLTTLQVKSLKNAEGSRAVQYRKKYFT